MKNGRRMVVGIMFVAAALLALFNKLDMFDGIKLWRLIPLLILALWLSDGIKKREWGSILFPIAFMCIVYSDFSILKSITPWPVLAAALLGSIGMNMICGNKKGEFTNSTGHIEYKEGKYGDGPKQANAGEKGVDNYFVFKNSFNSSSKYVSADDFVSADISCSFGEVKVYFDDVLIGCEEAIINVNVTFATVHLFLPKDWYVENHAVVVFGSVEEKNRSITNGTPRVSITGNVAFGDVSVTYC